MTPVARLQTAIELVDEILTGERPADAVLATYFRARRFIGSSDRRAVSEQTWRIVRHRARITWSLGTTQTTGRLLVAGDLALNDRKSLDAVAGMFSGAKNGPTPMSSNERRMVERAGTRDAATMPRADKLECPEWLLAKFDAAFGAEADKEVTALGTEAALDLRANTLKNSREDVLALLVAEELRAVPTPLSPFGIRVANHMNLGTHAGFRDGLFEVQDEGSQICAILADAQPGQAVMDYCAGAGGKTLALAAAMKNKGRLIACDVSEKRLERSKIRLRRAGAHNATLRVLEGDKWLRRQAGSFDRVVVDAPCSGTGAWRRNPDARWRFTPEQLGRLTATQDKLLDETAPLVKVGGRLAYITCSLLREENNERIAAFLARNAAFKPVPVADVWKTVLDTPPVADTEFLTLTPARNGTDGFFLALLERTA